MSEPITQDTKISISAKLAATGLVMLAGWLYNETRVNKVEIKENRAVITQNQMAINQSLIELRHSRESFQAHEAKDTITTIADVREATR